MRWWSDGGRTEYYGWKERGAPELGTERTKKSSRSGGRHSRLRGIGKDMQTNTERRSGQKGGKQKK